MSRACAREQGSIFVETLIAAAIVAMILGVAFQTIQGNARGARRVEIQREATLVAQSQLASVGATIPLSPGSVGGSEGAMAWRIEIAPYDGGLVSRAGRLLLVTVTVGEGRDARPAITLRSLRLAP